jgi:hypothetical protein
VIEDKNEREFQAYYEMLFHKVFPRFRKFQIFIKNSLAEKRWNIIKEWGRFRITTKICRTENRSRTINQQIIMTIKPEISWADFEKIDIRCGTIISVNDFEKARNPPISWK